MLCTYMGMDTMLYNWIRINGILGEQLNVNIVICVVLGLEFHLSTYVPMEYEWNRGTYI